EIPYLEGAPLADGEAERLFMPAVSAQTAPLWDHCRRALEHGFRLGSHGLPLIGSGDWNDGMNRVGIEGRGESVWLGWFLCAVLNSFSPLCEVSVRRAGRGSRAGSSLGVEDATGPGNQTSSRSKRYRAHVEKLKKGLEEAWDGDWYKRAYFDDG